MNWKKVIENKVYTKRLDLAKSISTWKSFNEKVVFTNGCFDILHLGHIDYLCKAADMGERMVIAVNTDASVSQLKGPGRPVIDEHTRMMKLAALAFVDAVILFPEETPEQLIQILKPDVLVKGGDYTEDNIVGAPFVKANGGSVAVIPFLEGHSTSKIIEKINKM